MAGGESFELPIEVFSVELFAEVSGRTAVRSGNKGA
jgi:hypothetical protein